MAWDAGQAVGRLLTGGGWSLGKVEFEGTQASQMLGRSPGGRGEAVYIPAGPQVLRVRAPVHVTVRA